MHLLALIFHSFCHTLFPVFLDYRLLCAFPKHQPDDSGRTSHHLDLATFKCKLFHVNPLKTKIRQLNVFIFPTFLTACEDTYPRLCRILDGCDSPFYNTRKFTNLHCPKTCGRCGKNSPSAVKNPIWVVCFSRTGHGYMQNGFRNAMKTGKQTTDSTKNQT